MFEHVLLVTDNATLLHEPLQWVQELVGEDAKYHVLCLINTGVAIRDDLETIYKQISRRHARQVVKQAKKILNKLDASVTSEIAEGSVVPTVKRVVEQRKVDLIVTENYDERGNNKPKMDRWVERIIRNVKVPVLNIARPDRLHTPTKVLVTDTDNDISDRTAEIAIWLGKKFEARLHVLNVVPTEAEEEDSPFARFKKSAKKEGLKVKRLEEPQDAKEWVTENASKYHLVVMDALHTGILGRLHPVQKAMMVDQDLPVILNWQE